MDGFSYTNDGYNLVNLPDPLFSLYSEVPAANTQPASDDWANPLEIPGLGLTSDDYSFLDLLQWKDFGPAHDTGMYADADKGVGMSTWLHPTISYSHQGAVPAVSQEVFAPATPSAALAYLSTPPPVLPSPPGRLVDGGTSEAAFVVRQNNAHAPQPTVWPPATFSGAALGDNTTPALEPDPYRTFTQPLPLQGLDPGPSRPQHKRKREPSAEYNSAGTYAGDLLAGTRYAQSSKSAEATSGDYAPPACPPPNFTGRASGSVTRQGPDSSPFSSIVSFDLTGLGYDERAAPSKRARYGEGPTAQVALATGYAQPAVGYTPLYESGDMLAASSSSQQASTPYTLGTLAIAPPSLKRHRDDDDSDDDESAASSAPAPKRKRESAPKAASASISRPVLSVRVPTPPPVAGPSTSVAGPSTALVTSPSTTLIAGPSSGGIGDNSGASMPAPVRFQHDPETLSKIMTVAGVKLPNRVWNLSRSLVTLEDAVRNGYVQEYRMKGRERYRDDPHVKFDPRILCPGCDTTFADTGRATDHVARRCKREEIEPTGTEKKPVEEGKNKPAKEVGGRHHLAWFQDVGVSAVIREKVAVKKARVYQCERCHAVLSRYDAVLRHLNNGSCERNQQKKLAKSKGKNKEAAPERK